MATCCIRVLCFIQAHQIENTKRGSEIEGERQAPDADKCHLHKKFHNFLVNEIKSNNGYKLPNWLMPTMFKCKTISCQVRLNLFPLPISEFQ